jgi:hypothetical protein
MFFSLCWITEFVLIKRCILERFGPSPILHLPWLFVFFLIYIHMLCGIYILCRCIRKTGKSGFTGSAGGIFKYLVYF